MVGAICTSIHVSEPPPLKSTTKKRGPTPTSEQFEDTPLFGKPSPSKCRKKRKGVKFSKAKKDKRSSPIEDSIIGDWARLVGPTTKEVSGQEPPLKKNKTGFRRKMIYKYPRGHKFFHGISSWHIVEELGKLSIAGLEFPNLGVVRKRLISPSSLR